MHENATLDNFAVKLYINFISPANMHSMLEIQKLQVTYKNTQYS